MAVKEQETEAEFKVKIAKYPEVMVYFFIDHCGAFIWRMNHDMANDRISKEHHASIDEDVVRVREQQVVAIRELTRFGVDVPLDEEDRPTENYWKWFRWWDEWKKKMSDDEWRRIDTMLSDSMSESQIQQCRPNGKWQDHDGKFH